MKKSNSFYPVYFIFFALLLAGCAGGVKPTPQTISERAKIIASELLGKQTPWITEHLGQPSFKRLDGHAEIWQYATSQCIINIFIYEDIEGGARRVLHFDTRDLGARPTPRDACINSL